MIQNLVLGIAELHVLGFEIHACENYLDKLPRDFFGHGSDSDSGEVEGANDSPCLYDGQGGIFAVCEA